MITVKYKSWTCILKFGNYANKRVKLSLVDIKDNFPIATATLNLSDERLKENEIIIKDYSENIGMAKALYEAKIITEPIKYINMGRDKTPICKLLINKNGESI